jgi:chromosome segregation ATPase
LVFLRGRLEQIEKLKMDEYERRLKQAAETRAKLEKENRELRASLVTIQLSIEDKEKTIATLQEQLLQIQSAMQQQAEFIESQQRTISLLRAENDELHAASSTQSGMSLASEMLELRVDALQQQQDKERAEHDAELTRIRKYAAELEEELEAASISLAEARDRSVVLSREKSEQQEVFREQLKRMTMAFEAEKEKREEYEQALKLFTSSSREPSVTRESIIASGSDEGLFFSGTGNTEEASLLDLSAILQGNDEAGDKELTTRVGASAVRP